LGFTNWPVILLHQQTPTSFLAPSSPRHQQRGRYCCDATRSGAALLRRQPQWRGTSLCDATGSGAAGLELASMLKLKVKIMLKLEITNIGTQAANKLKIK
jgi:hypothetical protein